MNRLTKFPLALALGGAMAVGTICGAQASVMATSVSEITNFEIHKAGGAALDVTAGDFATLSFTSTGGYAGTLDGTPGYTAGSSAVPVDLLKTCVGNGCAAWNAAYGADDSFTHLSAPPAGNYSAADQQEAGSPIVGLPGLALDAAYAGLTDQNALSHATATNNLNAEFTFTLSAAGSLDFIFDLDNYLQIAVTSGEQLPGFATASFQITFGLQQETAPGSGIFTSLSPTPWNISSGACGTPNQVNPLQDASMTPTCTESISKNAPVGSDFEQILSGTAHYVFTTPTLAAGTLYKLSARNNSNADVQRIPEPGELALLGIGLIGMTVVMSRRRNQIGGAI